MLNMTLRQAVEALNFHPRATKLMLKKKNFIVIAEDEYYFLTAYGLIRAAEQNKGTWTEEDERLYIEAVLKADHGAV